MYSYQRYYGHCYLLNEWVTHLIHGNTDTCTVHLRTGETQCTWCRPCTCYCVRRMMTVYIGTADAETTKTRDSLRWTQCCFNLFTTIHDGKFRRHSSMNVTIKWHKFSSIYTTFMYFSSFEAGNCVSNSSFKWRKIALLHQYMWTLACTPAWKSKG